MADATLPLPPVQDSYSSRLHGWRGRHTSLSTNMGSIFQQPSNFLIKPVRPCLNLTCKRYCMKTQIRQHITCVDQRDWQCFKVLQYDFFCSGQQKHELTRCQTTRGISRLLPAPLQLLASTLHQARLFLILLPENETLSLSWYLPLGWDFGSFPLMRKFLGLLLIPILCKK